MYIIVCIIAYTILVDTIFTSRSETIRNDNDNDDKQQHLLWSYTLYDTMLLFIVVIIIVITLRNDDNNTTTTNNNNDNDNKQHILWSDNVQT